MSRKPRWDFNVGERGYLHIALSSWKYFPDLIHQLLLDKKHFVYRGQRSEHWELEPSFHRMLRNGSKHTNLMEHLENFKYAMRGRRGLSPAPLLSDDDWLAIGQHNGLATPLLDLTESPYVAAYFAFHEERKSDDGRAAVWAVSYQAIQHLAKNVRANSKFAEIAGFQMNALEIVRPLLDDNARLVNQAGLFLKVPIDTDARKWVYENYPKDRTAAVLVKITIPAKDRLQALKSLNSMNINHLTLFPDAYGASVHANSKLLIKGY